MNADEDEKDGKSGSSEQANPGAVGTANQPAETTHSNQANAARRENSQRREDEVERGGGRLRRLLPLARPSKIW